MPIVTVMVRETENKKTANCGMSIIVSRREEEKRLFLLLYDLEIRDVSRSINKKKKEKSMCYTLCKFLLT